MKIHNFQFYYLENVLVFAIKLTGINVVFSSIRHSATYMHEFERPKNLPIAGRCEAGGAIRKLKLKMKIYIFSDSIQLNNV